MQATVLIARANSKLSPNGEHYSEEALRQIARDHQGFVWDEERQELCANVDVSGSDVEVLRWARRWGVEPFVANQQYQGRNYSFDTLMQWLNERRARRAAENPFREFWTAVTPTLSANQMDRHDSRDLSEAQQPPWTDGLWGRQAKEQAEQAAKERKTETELRVLFHDLWTRDVGTPGYDKEKWQRLTQLLYLKGIKSLS